MGDRLLSTIAHGKAKSVESWLAAQHIFVKLKEDSQDDPLVSDFHYAYLIQDERLGETVFIDHTGYIGPLALEVVADHDDWVAFEERILANVLPTQEDERTVRYVVEKLTTSQTKKAAAILLAECVDIERYHKARTAIMMLAKQRTNFAKTVIAEALRENVPPELYSNLIAEDCGLDWLVSAVADVREMVEHRAKK